MAAGPVVLVAGALAVLLLATANGYGYHRDELYFRLLGQRPEWGYVDQPPATPLLARLTTELFGDHLWALRLPGALVAAATAILTALLARELGAGRAGQLLAALGAATAFPLVFGHVLLTATLDMVVGAAVLLSVARALLRDERWWLAVGALVGVGLYNKHLIVLALAAVGVALVLVGPRRTLASRWLWIGVAIALAVGAPNLVYQATHGWPQLAMAEAIERNKGAESRALFVPMQLVLLGPLLAPVWIAGLVRLLRDPALRPARALGVAYPILCVLVLVSGGQPYYTLALVLALYAAGCAPTVRWLAGRRPRVALLGGALAINAIVSGLIALPLLPVPALARTPIPAANQATSDQVGWPRYVAQIAEVYHGLPPADRDRAVIVTANYGEAGALDRYGDRHDLPAVYSGHNELYHRGAPPETASVVVAVGFRAGPALEAAFGSCVVVRDLDNGVDIPNEEQELNVRVCRDPRGPWSQLWPRFQHYD
ncbi:Dolichyl-phosphate-mannose-protein mannosyltransferase [Micromonospora pattaloongensis]|uniref:Dolichyl-phosphate-mannose-protein mannosyltransferase n=2 Tax=Micromonospora pattaloongensis TaxID=405436 RepID=A0A1H3P0V8_9ACTN|nr:Dolichyl-phosphate-mannose-protein mannosyltransferase [Micromonospora pattaloongensis]